MFAVNKTDTTHCSNNHFSFQKKIKDDLLVRCNFSQGCFLKSQSLREIYPQEEFLLNRQVVVTPGNSCGKNTDLLVSSQSITNSCEAQIIQKISRNNSSGTRRIKFSASGNVS